MLVTMAVPPIVLVWYAYTSDFQAQGRYVMPAVIPVMYFVTLGYEQWFSGIFKRKGRQMVFPARLYVLYHQRGLYLCSGLLAVLQIMQRRRLLAIEAGSIF